MSAEQKQELVAQSQSSSMSAILDLAKDPSMDVAKLKALVEMQQDILDRQAKNAFAVDFVRMKPHLKKIENKHLNSQTKSKYAKLEDINREVDPILEQFGFSSMTPVRRQDENTVTVAAILLHKDGHQEETELTLPLDKAGIQGTVNKTGPHAIASSIKYCRRIALCAILNLSTGDGVDKDGNGERDTKVVTTEQAVEIDTRARAISIDYHQRLMTWLGVENAKEIAETDYKKALASITKAESEKKVKSNAA